MKILVFVLSLYNLKWARKCWSTRGMIRHASADPLRACVKVADYCDPSSAGILTYIKMIETCVQSPFATVCVQFAIADHFFYFGDDS
jgi:hypothetical protein